MGGFFLLFIILRFGMMLSFGGFSIIELTSYMGLAVTSLSIGYLQPQVIQKDERMKHIRQKAMQYSLMATLVYMFLLMFLLQLQLVKLTSFEAIALIANSTIITVWVIWIYLSKKM